MTYDELEEQFYILSQRNADLERELNSLTLRNITLEGQNIVLENEMQVELKKNEAFSKSLQEECLKTINVKVQLESEQKRSANLEDQIKLSGLEGNRELVHSALERDSIILQQAANGRDFSNLARIPKYSVHAPMQEVELHREQTSIILHGRDIFGVEQFIDAKTYDKQWHAYAKLGTKVVRYSTQQSMFDLHRREDFAVVLNQLTDGLRDAIIEEYVRTEFR
jgi:hypothetical protein